MTAAEETSKDFRALAKEMTPRQLRNSLKRAYRAEAKKIRGMALQGFRAANVDVRGNRQDIEKGIRVRIFPRGGGFMLTLKPHKSNGAGVHENRHYRRTGKKWPVLMWLEDGTKMRKTRTRGSKRGHSTGRVPVLGFIEGKREEMNRAFEADMAKELESAVEKVARKHGLI